MKKSIILFLLSAFFPVFAFAAPEAAFNGKTISEINIKTARISPEIVREKFLMEKGEVFNADNYDFAKQCLHDMRVFKTIDFSITDNGDNTITINIDAKDSYYVFPLIFGSGGSKNTVAAALMEANLFKSGEVAYLFGLVSTDGYMAMGGLGLNNNFFSAVIKNMEYEEKVFDNGSYNTSGFFSSADNLDDFGTPVKQYKVKSNSQRLLFSKSFMEKTSLMASFDFAEVKYSGNDTPRDAGSHNKFSFSFKKHKNSKPGGSMGGNFGALFGIGLSDIKDRLSDLEKTKYGYLINAVYENGGDYTGSDFSISKFYLKTMGNAELKKRHILTLDFSAAKVFEAPFYDKLRSPEVLSGQGVYSREFRGEEALGLGTSFAYYLIKNTTGILTLVPFVESAVIWDGGERRNLTGAGASISYRLWRIPFPIGLNYTQNVTDGSYNFSFLFGGGF